MLGLLNGYTTYVRMKEDVLWYSQLTLNPQTAAH